ncbi:MAG: DUF1573 domain-containing protein [Bacteroidales bacterium]
MLPTVVTISQSAPRLSFIAKEHNFGIIEEEGGIKFHEFRFTNNTERPLTIRDVRSSCGCTQPAFDRKTIHPGEEGSIRVGYDGIGRPGDFERWLIVDHSSGQDTLIVRGHVKRGNIARCPGFRYRHGSLCLKRETVFFKNFDSTRKQEETILIQNGSDSDITLHFTGISDCFSLFTESGIVKAGQQADLIIRYDPAKGIKPEKETIYEVREINEKNEQNLFDLKITL